MADYAGADETKKAEDETVIPFSRPDESVRAHVILGKLMPL